MAKAKITAKIMEEGLKKNWTTVEFCEALSISEEELFEIINKSFSSRAAQAYIRKLKKNVKKPVPKKNGKTTFFINSSDLKADVPVSTSSHEVSKVSQKDCAVEDLTADDIQADIESLNGILIKLESEKKDVIAENNSLKEQLQKNISEFTELRSKMQSLIDVSNNIQDKISSNLQRIEKFKEDIASAIVGRENLERHLKELQRITLLLNDDGAIEPEIEVPYTWEGIYQQLFDGSLGYNEVIDQLTRAQIKQIAKVMAYVSTLDVPYEYVADNAEVEHLLDSLLS